MVHGCLHSLALYSLPVPKAQYISSNKVHDRSKASKQLDIKVTASPHTNATSDSL